MKFTFSRVQLDGGVHAQETGPEFSAVRGQGLPGGDGQDREEDQGDRVLMKRLPPAKRSGKGDGRVKFTSR
jgi:hypothetical protein